MTLFAKVIELLRAADADDIVVFGGGIIPEADRAPLAELGVAQVFTPGATMAEIVDWVRKNVRPGGARGMSPRESTQPRGGRGLNDPHH